MTTENQKIELTASQENPYLARPEDFEVMTPDIAATKNVPGHGQLGKNKREHKALLREAFSKPGRSQWQSKGQELPAQAM